MLRQAINRNFLMTAFLGALAIWLCLFATGPQPAHANDAADLGPLPANYNPADPDPLPANPGPLGCEGSKEYLRRLYDIRIIYARELRRHQKNIVDIKELLKAARKTGEPFIPFDRLVPEGKAGIGVVGVGKTKPRIVQEQTEWYEKWYRWHNHGGALVDIAWGLIAETWNADEGLSTDRFTKGFWNGLARLQTWRSQVQVNRYRSLIRGMNWRIDLQKGVVSAACRTSVVGGPGATGPRSDSGGGGADGSGLTCPTTRAYAYAPDAVIVPTVGDPNSGHPCMPLAGWHLPANARCGVSVSGPPKPVDVAAGCPATPTASGPRACPPGQHWSRDLGKCHAGN